ncbi:MAG TPA: DUF58 domain-containing protein [Polyangiaceae bacterium]|jgi:uncharacterized protein (DUF58 family)
MRLYPSRPTFHVAVASASLIALGAAARLPPVVAFGGAMLLAVALGRAIARVAVTRLREEGFEMVWDAPARVHTVARGGTLSLTAEIRNRSAQPVRCVGLRPVVSSMLSARVEPTELDLPPRGRAGVEVTVHTDRVGRWGIHGLALEVRGTPVGGEGLYEVPLLFASPLGVEVLPRSLALLHTSPRGGRARRASETGRPAAAAGEGEELRELRDHAPGDAFRRIAWRASARRGKLLVREMERDDLEVLWLVVDASVELLAGPPGQAPLDRVLDQVADRATRCLRRGCRVGLVVTSSRLRAWVPPGQGAAQAVAIASALAGAASCVDEDRSELDEPEVAVRVAEHARPLDPRGLADLPKGDIDALAKRADQLRDRAPFAMGDAFASTPREQVLRRYMAAFGMESPPRSEGERDKTEGMLAKVLERLASEKPKASGVHVWALPPTRPGDTAKAVAILRSRRLELRWTVPPLEEGVGAGRIHPTAVSEAIDDAVRLRAVSMKTRGERLLRRMGIRVVAKGAS